ncbi:Os02g0177633, partial [Oryza sativa Japonica Group]
MWNSGSRHSITSSLLKYRLGDSWRAHLLGDAGDEAAVGEHDALGEAGGAGGVGEGDDVVGVDVGVGVELLRGEHLAELHAAVERAVHGDHGDAPLRGELPHLLDGARLGDDHPGARGLRLAVDLVRRVERVRRRGGGAQPGRAEEGEGELGAVAEEAHHHVALAHPHPPEPRRGAPRRGLHLRVRVRLPGLPVDQARPRPDLRHPREAVLLQRHAVVDLDVRQLRPEHHHLLRR